MNKQLPKVSIIIPCYNQGAYLDATIESVVTQDYSNWECILVNDGSTDNTSAIIAEWEIKDERIKSYYKENGGLSSARNYGLKNVTGDFIQFLDSDDVLHPNKLKISLEQAEGLKDNVIVISNYVHFETSINEITPAYYNLKKEYFNLECVLFQWDTIFTIPIHCGLFSVSLFKDFSFPESLKAKEDWFMWIHLFSKHPKVGFINKSLAYYRVHNESMTNSNSSKMMENSILFFDLVKSEISALDYIKLIEESNKKFINKYFVEVKKINNIKASYAFKMGHKIIFILNKIGLKKLSESFIEKYSKK